VRVARSGAKQGTQGADQVVRQGAGRKAQGRCEAQGSTSIAGRKIRYGTPARRGTRGVAFRRISEQVEGREGHEEVPAHVPQLGILPHGEEGSREEVQEG
jgi:hypothetical protein